MSNTNMTPSVVDEVKIDVLGVELNKENDQPSSVNTTEVGCLASRKTINADDVLGVGVGHHLQWPDNVDGLNREIQAAITMQSRGEDTSKLETPYADTRYVAMMVPVAEEDIIQDDDALEDILEKERRHANKILTFRGEPIYWTGKAVKNALSGEWEIDENTSSRLRYREETYTMLKFLEFAFPEFRKYHIKGIIRDKRIARLSDRRYIAIVLYQMCRKYELVEVSNKDQEELMAILTAAPGRTAELELFVAQSKYYDYDNNGVRRLITFGVPLVPQKRDKEIGCYSYDLKGNLCTLTPSGRTFEDWFQSIGKKLGEVDRSEAFMMLHYQNYFFLSLAGYTGVGREWVIESKGIIKDHFGGEMISLPPVPFSGLINEDMKKFTIDLDKEVSILDIKERNSSSEERGDKSRTSQIISQERYRDFPEEWTSGAELCNEGFNRGSLNSAVKAGVIEVKKEGRKNYYRKVQEESIEESEFKIRTIEPSKNQIKIKPPRLDFQ